MQLSSIRRSLRISLRALLLAVTASSIALGFVAHRANRQREVVRLIRSQSGVVDYDCNTLPAGDCLVVAQPESRYPRWLVDMLGIDYFHEVVAVSLHSSAACDETLAAVASLPGIETLHLTETRISECGLLQLGRMSNLRTLTLNTTGVSDETLTTIARLPKIEAVSIFSAQVTNAGLAKLEPCPRLEYLYFEDTDVTEEALTSFHQAHPKCRTGYSSPGFKSTAWAPKRATVSARQGSDVH